MNLDHIAKMLSANFNAHEAALAALRKNLIPTSTLTAIADATTMRAAMLNSIPRIDPSILDAVKMRQNLLGGLPKIDTSVLDTHKFAQRMLDGLPKIDSSLLDSLNTRQRMLDSLPQFDGSLLESHSLAQRVLDGLPKIDPAIFDSLKVRQQLLANLPKTDFPKPLIDAALSSNFKKLSEGITKGIYDTIAGLNLAFGKQLQDQFRMAADVSARLTDLARLTDKIRLSAHFLAEFDINRTLAGMLERVQEIPDLGKLRQLESKVDQHNARDILFAIWEGEACVPEQEKIQTELAKIPDFDQRSINAKLDALLAIAEENQSPRLLAYLVAVALNMVATSMGQDYSALVWALIGVVLIVDYCRPKRRVPDTRAVLRSVQVETSQARIVRRTCAVLNLPKSKSQRIGRLEVGYPVTLADRFGKWRQIIFIVEGRQRAGWVRAKYLRKI